MRRLLLLMCALLMFSHVFAQNRVISGTVTDETSNPLQGASILVKGTSIGTTTNAAGAFSISVPTSAKILVFSYQGFDQQEITIGNKTVIQLTLKAEDKSLDEVVVVGYQVKRKRDEAGAISTVGAKQLENLPSLSLDQALQGKAAGVLVRSNSGLPGGAITVRIRGAGSINAGNDPLYIVDGVQLNTRNDASFTQSNPLSFLNPDDIESIDILKDAASASIYGASAANGVVLITTKKGKAGKTKFTFNTYVGQASPLKYLDVTNSQQYYQLRAEAYANSNFGTTPADLAIKRIVLGELRVPNASLLSAAGADSAIANLQTYDWQEAAFRNSVLQNYEFNVSGGTDRTTFRVSTSYTKQEAVVTIANFRRSALKLDITNKATDRLTIGTSLNLTSGYQNIPFATDGSFLGSPAFSASGIIPVNPIFNPDGTFYGIPGGTPANLIGTLNQNIIAVNTFNSGYNRTNQLVGNATVDYRINSWLSFRTLFGLDYRLVQGKSVRDARTPDAFVRKGLVQTQSTWNTNFQTYQTLNFNHTFSNKHRVDGLAGIEYRKENQESISASGDGFPTFQFTSLNNAANPLSVGEFFTGYRRNSFFANANYTFDRKYGVGVTYRRDGSSRFGTDFRYGNFGGIKANWNIDREDFLANTKVNKLVLRAGYGSVGNDQIGNFDALGLFGGGGVYNGGAGIAYTQLANPKLKWEKSTSLNVGVDFGFFRDRISGSVEVYDKLNSDLLLNQPLQSTTGFTSIATNIGKVSNKGVELTLGVEPFRSVNKGGFSWSTQFTFGYNKQEVEELYSGLKQLPGGGVQVGQPVNVLFTQKYAGVNPATGRPMWYDTLGNLTYQVAARDRVIIGPTALPKFNGGFRNSFSYKNFSLEAFFQFEYGRYATDGQVNFLTENIARINELTTVFDKRWTTPGQLTMFPRFLTTGTESKGSAAQSGTARWFKADYVRLKNLTLSYDFSPTMLRNLKVANARFYVTSTNLLTYSDWYSYDIEFVGTATGIIPTSKNVIVGLNIGF